MYYQIKNRTDKEVGGVFPQALSINQELIHSIKSNEFTNFDTELVFALDPNAKLTDVLSEAAILANGILINRKTKDLLDNFNVMQHRYYKCIVTTKGKQHDYYYLHLLDDFTKMVDYSQSVFYWTKSTFRKGEITLSSYEEYLNKKKENGILWGVDAEVIVLNHSFNKNLDLFSCLPFNKKVYLSEVLANEFKKQLVTGISINEAPNIFGTSL